MQTFNDYNENLPEYTHKIKQKDLNKEIIQGTSLKNIKLMNSKNPKFNTTPRSSVIYNQRLAENQRGKIYNNLNLTPKSSYNKGLQQEKIRQKNEVEQEIQKTREQAIIIGRDELKKQFDEIKPKRRMNRQKKTDNTKEFLENL